MEIFSLRFCDQFFCKSSDLFGLGFCCNNPVMLEKLSDQISKQGFSRPGISIEFPSAYFVSHLLKNLDLLLFRIIAVLVAFSISPLSY
jgi:hypothetical protein